MDSEGKEWNEELLTKLFWQKDMDTIKNISISQVGNKEILLWKYTSQGVYSIQSVYQQLQLRDVQRKQQARISREVEEGKKIWKRTWKMQIKGKLKHFIWRCYHNTILTRTQLAKKGFKGDQLYAMCAEGVENLEHLFFKCRRTQIVWKLVLVKWDELAKEAEHFP